jgi:hypothetical protein
MSVTKSPRRESVAVFVDVSGGEFLLYRVTARGVRPIFTLVDSEVNALLLSNKDTPVTNSPLVYERRWPLPADSREAMTNHTLGMNFLAAPITYTYVVEHHLANESVVLIDDIDFTSSTPDDWFFQGLSVTTD